MRTAGLILLYLATKLVNALWICICTLCGLIIGFQLSLIPQTIVMLGVYIFKVLAVMFFGLILAGLTCIYAPKAVNWCMLKLGYRLPPAVFEDWANSFLNVKQLGK